MGFVSKTVSEVGKNALPLAATAAGYYFGGPLGAVAAGSLTKAMTAKPPSVSTPTVPPPPSPATAANATSAAGTSKKAAGAAASGGTMATSPEGLTEPPKTAGVTLLGGGQ